MRTLSISFLFGLTILLTSPACAQQIVIGTPPLIPSNIQVTASPSTIAIGGISTLTAILLDANNNPKNDVTKQCAFYSSDLTIINVVGNLATGVAAGSATANCTLGNITGTTPVNITVSNVVITNPLPSCTAPCALPQGVNGTAYGPFAFAGSTSLPPITWSVSVGSLPGWASLNSSTGAVTGTPNANGTTSFTILATDAGAHTASLAVSLTVVASSGFGPPTYLGSTTNSSNPGTIAPYFSSSSAQNSTAFDPTLNPATDCIDLATTAATSYNGHSQAGSMSGGANGHDWAWDETMLAVNDVDGGVSILGITTSAGCPQVTNTGVPAWRNILGAVAFDWVTSTGKTNHDIYQLQSHHIIKKASVSNINSMGAFTTVFDFTAVNACPGPIPSPVTSGSIFTPVSDGNGGLQFAQAIGAGIQGTANTVFVYSTTKGCTSVDLKNGFYYPWCVTTGTGGTNCSSESGIALATTGTYCYGLTNATDAIHDGQPTGDGTMVRLSVSSGGHGATHGVCVGNTTGTQTIAWQINTGSTFYTNGASEISANCPTASGVHCEYDGHPSDGISKALGNGGGLSMNIRNVSNYSGAFSYVAPNLQTFGSNGVPNDYHSAWIPANTPDAFPMLVGATDLIVTSTPSPCAPTSAVLCPPYLAYVAYALPVDGSNNPPRLFVHTHSCGQTGASFWQCPSGPDFYFYDQQSVPSVSPQGNYISFPSTDLQSFGTDGAGHPRSNILIVKLQ